MQDSNLLTIPGLAGPLIYGGREPPRAFFHSRYQYRASARSSVDQFRTRRSLLISRTWALWCAQLWGQDCAHSFAILEENWTVQLEHGSAGPASDGAGNVAAGAEFFEASSQATAMQIAEFGEFPLPDVDDVVVKAQERHAGVYESIGVGEGGVDQDFLWEAGETWRADCGIGHLHHPTGAGPGVVLAAPAPQFGTSSTRRRTIPRYRRKGE